MSLDKDQRLISTGWKGNLDMISDIFFYNDNYIDFYRFLDIDEIMTNPFYLYWNNENIYKYGFLNYFFDRHTQIFIRPKNTQNKNHLYFYVLLYLFLKKKELKSDDYNTALGAVSNANLDSIDLFINDGPPVSIYEKLERLINFFLENTADIKLDEYIIKGTDVQLINKNENIKINREVNMLKEKEEIMNFKFIYQLLNTYVNFKLKFRI